MIIKPEKFTPINIEGLSILDMTDGVDSDISIARISVMSKVTHRRTVSNKSDKYYYILFGRLAFTLDENTFNVKAGELVIVGKGQSFSYANPTDDPVEMLLINPVRISPETEALTD